MEIYKPDLKTKCKRPLFDKPVPAGSPDSIEDSPFELMDLNEMLVENPVSTFFLRSVGDSMIGAGIYPGSVLVVDKSIEPIDKKVVIAALNGGFTVKRLRIKEDGVYLYPENDKYKPLKLTKDVDCYIWGVVVHVIAEI